MAYGGSSDMAIDSDDDAAAPPPPPAAAGTPGGAVRRTSMTETEQKERRASIQAIMKDNTLTPQERRRSIQALMDGRRRSSTASGGGGGGMAAAAAAAAAAFDDSDDSDEDDSEMMGSSTGDRSSFASSTGGGAMQNGGPGARGRPNRSSLRDSLTSGFSAMGVTSGGDNSGGYGGISTSSPSLLGGNSARRDSTQSFTSGTSASASSVDLSTGHHLGSAIGSSRKMEKTRPECNHYDRRCTIVSPCCGLAFGCRICHDDCPVLPPPIFGGGDEAFAAAAGGAAAAGLALAPSDGHDSDGGGGKAKKKKMMRSSSMPSNFTEEETHHDIDRFAIREVICRECYTRQSSKTNNCIKCNIQFGDYHCNICNLWMSADEEPYHCQDCGFCRVGGRENFKHCHDCGMCIDSLLFDDHNCKTGKYMSNCPVCQEDLFSSRSASHEMPCGHAIHWHCFRELTSFDTRCPVCKKTAETHEQMAPTWQAMAMGIALQPVPPDLARVVTIICNDCEERDEDRRWHFLGVQCMRCTSFNTTVETTQLVGHEAAAFLGDVDGTSANPGAGGAQQADTTSAFSGRAEAASFDASMSNGMDAAAGAAAATAGGGGAAAGGQGPPGADGLDYRFLAGGGQDQAMHGSGVHDMVMDAMDGSSGMPGRGAGPSSSGGGSSGQPR